MELHEIVGIAAARSAGRHVSIDVAPGVVRPVDVAALAQILSELVENAAHASASQGSVSISGSISESHSSLSVSDHGHGIPARLLEMLNTALSSPADLPDGSASGLANVARLARKHGMTVRLDSGTAGTTAVVELPPDMIEIPSRPAPSRNEHVDDGPETNGDDGSSTTVTALPGDQALDMAWPTTGALAYSDEEAELVEEFLAEVFGRLLDDERGEPTEPVPVMPGTEIRTTSPVHITELRVRVPGTSFSDEAADAIHSAAADGANEIRFALTKYDLGREAARRSEDTGTPD